MRKELIQCLKIMVNCTHNDPVDIKAGGPENLGFDFFVKSDDVQEMITFITLTLQEYKIPLVNIGIGQETVSLSPNEVWTKEKITECIKNDASYLIHEASRGYSYKKSRF